MKNRIDNNYSRYPAFFTAVILFLLLLNACAGEQQGRPVPKKVIPEKDLNSIIRDLYLSDGLLAVSQIRDKYRDKDSVLVYIDIITDHGYTKEEMDMTMEYYFVRKPKKLIKIYDRILGELTEIDTRLSNMPAEGVIPEDNEWTGLPAYTFPDPSGIENPGFSIPLNGQGTYSLVFTVTVYPIDNTVNPGFSAWFCSADSTETGKKYYLPPVKYFKDGFPHTYTVTGYNSISGPVLLKGSLYDHETNPEIGERHGIIREILFLYSKRVL